MTDQVDAIIQAESSAEEVRLLQTTQSVEVEASMGDVDIKVSPDFKGRYDLKASMGDIEIID